MLAKALLSLVLSPVHLFLQVRQVQGLELLLQGGFYLPRDIFRSHQALVGRLGCVVDLPDLRPDPNLRNQLRRGEEEVHVEPVNVIEVVESFHLFVRVVPGIAGHPPDDGPVLLFHVAVVVFVAGPGQRRRLSFPPRSSSAGGSL